jgi:hypothetical protein
MQGACLQYQSAAMCPGTACSAHHQHDWHPLHAGGLTWGEPKHEVVSALGLQLLIEAKVHEHKQSRGIIVDQVVRLPVDESLGLGLQTTKKGGRQLCAA